MADDYVALWLNLWGSGEAYVLHRLLDALFVGGALAILAMALTRRRG